MKRLASLFLGALLMLSVADAKGNRNSGRRPYGPSSVHSGDSAARHSPRYSKTMRTRFQSANREKVKCSSCARDPLGRIARSSTAKHGFQRSHPCPSTGSTSGACPGYVIDHVKALKHGGTDTPGNMQWQTTAEAKAKDRVE
jgi:hypothetical protein